MLIFICEDSYDGILTGIYDTWEAALSEGHDQVRLVRNDFGERTMFDELRNVIPDYEKAEKVRRSVRDKISPKALYWVEMAILCSAPDAPMAIYSFLRKGFRYGASVCSRLNDPDVARMMEIQRRIDGESYHFREFARFNRIGTVYISHIEPIDNVILPVGEAFADRMPSENFMIVDDNRNLAVVHQKDEENVLRILTDEEMDLLKESEKAEDEFTSMWRDYVRTIAVKERYNPKCQNSHFPKYKRKHATEFL